MKGARWWRLSYVHYYFTQLSGMNLKEYVFQKHVIPTGTRNNSKLTSYQIFKKEKEIFSEHLLDVCSHHLLPNTHQAHHDPN